MFKVDGGDAVLLRKKGGDFFFLDEPELDEVETELATVGFLKLKSLLKLLLGYEPPL